MDAPTDVLSFPMFPLEPGAPPTLEQVEADPGTGPGAPGGHGDLPGAGEGPGGGVRPWDAAGGGLPGGCTRRSTYWDMTIWTRECRSARCAPGRRPFWDSWAWAAGMGTGGRRGGMRRAYRTLAAGLLAALLFLAGVRRDGGGERGARRGPDGSAHPGDKPLGGGRSHPGAGDPLRSKPRRRSRGRRSCLPPWQGRA